MTTTTSHVDGATCWADLSTDDIDGAVDFYSALVGWSAAPGSPETAGYRRAEIKGHDVAGIGPKSMPGQPNAWLPYIQTSDIAASLAKASSLGASTLFGPHEVMSFGSMAAISDPVGAVIGLWQPNEMKGFGAIDEHGAWTWSELMTSDLDGSVEFYSKLFGWTPTASMAASNEYREMQIGGRSIAGIMPRPEQMPDEVPNFWGIYLNVDSLDTALDVVKARGGHVAVGPMPIEPGTFAQIVDPQGAMLGLLQPKS